ncbi:hypothetical protein UPYG_G00331240 [Umbra pygmaea]|uniref:Proline-rich protein 15 n=1 Tax=Umbra pygmaea TaxID=75934 RepID=A0ABD0W9Q2_UMBPY
MAERVPWWRAFMGSSKKKSRDTNLTLDPDKDSLTQAAFNPSKLPTEQQANQKQPPLQQPQKQQPPASGGTSLFTNDFVDDSQFESIFNEQTCRRNLKVSRSGRFKERKKIRSSLPTDDNIGIPGKDETR